MPFRDRALLLTFLIPVDLIVGFEQDTPLKLISAIRPDVLAKGADYKISEIVGATEVKSWGGKVSRIRLASGKSTSALLRRLAAIPN
jgi:D-beta-D-heptose 7-phosphate kinase/D-beta-D-heptose 1-phosphate adenosyltransferase